MLDELQLEQMMEAPVESDVPSDYPFIMGEYDKKLLTRVKGKMKSWRDLSKRREPEYKQFDRFMDSAYMSLWKPTLIDVAPLTPEAESIKQILGIAENMPEWQELQQRVCNNYVMSALATVVIGEHIVFPEPQEGGGEGEGEGEGEEGDGDGDGQAPNMGEVREAISQAVSAANEATEQAETLSQLWGTEAGEDLKNDPELLLTLSRTLKDSSRLQIISRMLGRLKNQMFRAQMTKVDYIPEEFVDITLGNNLRDMLPSSFLYMSDPDLEVVFLLRYIQHGLVQQVREGMDKLGRGPIIALVDVSGSMQASLGVIPGVGNITRVDWAAAVALVLTMLARQQNREYCIVLFDSYIRKEILSTSGDVTTEDLVQMMAVKGSGGTNFMRALDRGVEVLEYSAFDKADIVFVTDGECQVSESYLKKFRATKAERGFSVLSIACANIEPASLKPFSDRVLSVSSVLDADEANHEIFSLGG